MRLFTQGLLALLTYEHPSLLRCLCVSTYMCVGLMIHMHCVLMCDGPPCPFSLLSPVLVELQQADLITSEECRGLDDSSDVVRVQSGKSPEVQSKTAVVLRSHGYTKVSDHLTSKQALPLTMCLWCVVQWSLVVFRCEVHLGTAIAWYVDPSSIPTHYEPTPVVHLHQGHACVV